MTTVTAREAEQVAAANASGRSRSCSSTGSGCCTAAGTPGARCSRSGATRPSPSDWPDDPATNAEAHAHPELREEVGRPGRRPRRGGDPARPQADRDRALVRRAARPDRRRSRARRRLGGDRPGAQPRGAAAAVLRPEGVLPGARQPGQPGQAVTLTFDQFRSASPTPSARRRRRRLYETFHVPGRAPALPGRHRQPRPDDRGKGGQKQSRARPDVDRLRR